jgi:hypothetical protein
MTGHMLAVVALVVALALVTTALLAALGASWGGLASGALWALVAALLVDPEAMRR